MNVEAVVLKMLLKSESKELALTRFSNLQVEFFSPSYASIIQAIERFYKNKGVIPSLELLEMDCSRSPSLSNSISALKSLDIDADSDDFDLAVGILKDQFTQKKYLELVSKSLNNLSLLTSEEIIEMSGTIATSLEDIIKPDSYLRYASDIQILKSAEDAAEDVMYLGISNKFDAEYGAARRQEVVLVGGRRGAGKSVICINIASRGVESGFVVPYFSIEMSGEETKSRAIAINSGVEAIKVRNQSFDINDLEKIIQITASQYINGAEIYEQHKERLIDMQGYIELEKHLIAEGVKDSEKGELVIIDDQDLKLSSLDMYITKLKAKHGNKLGPVIVDYVNQIVVDGCREADMYNWTNQIIIAKRLKALARKHDITIFAPYQIDEHGEARMAKGILDSCDFAFTVEPVSKEGQAAGALKWKGVKARGLPVINFAIPIDWSTLKISPDDLNEKDVLAIMGTPAEEEDTQEEAEEKEKLELI
jgi:KaiC/GvpD/RAD55 family RecA-like ATPase